MKARQVYRLSLVVISISAFVNIVVAVRVILSLRNPVQYNFRVVEPPVYTNVFTSGTFDLRMPGAVKESVPAAGTNCFLVTTNDVITELAVEAYHYMRVDGSPAFRLNGYNYKVGDTCVYGRILAVYPERIIVDRGYISNSRRVFDLVPFSPSVLHPVQNMEVQNAERSDNS